MRLHRRGVVYTGIFLIAGLFLFFSCGGGERPTLDGTWTLTTENNSGDDVGDGTFTISFVVDVPELNTNFYSGQAIMTNGSGDTDYKVSVEYKYGTSDFDFYLYLYQDPDPKSQESIRMSGYASGSSSASGTYDVIGTKYAHFGTGRFDARKQE